VLWDFAFDAEVVAHSQCIVSGMTKGDTERKCITTDDGHTIYYETSRVNETAPVVVLVHGIGGDVDGWQYVRDILIENAISTIALDVRGHGYSSHPRRAQDYAMELLLKDILQVLDAENLKKVILVGHSGGAVLSLNFALTYQERLSALVLLAGSYRSPAYMHHPIPKRIADVMVTIGAFISPPAMKPWHSTYPRGKFNREYEPWGLMRTIAHNSLRSYLLVGKEIMNIGLEDRLEEITVPTLLIAGENDTIYPLSISKKMHEKIPGSLLKVIPGANHVIILNNIEETAGHIVEFITNLQVGG
jgi:pimeloyl-ACP methyl ester carboxylesterase